MDQNLISITTIAYNAGQTLLKTLTSILEQEDVYIELILVNDASTDNTLQIMENFKAQNPQITVQIISNNTNLGITKSRNSALSNCNGDFIAVLDSDDVWTDKQKLKKQLDFLRANPEHILVGTQMQKVFQNGDFYMTTSYETSDQEIRKKFLIQNQFCHSSILMRKTNHFYNESLYIWEDYEYFLQIAQLGKVANLQDIMLNYLYVPHKYSFSKKLKLIKTELEIISLYKNSYPNFWIGYLKRVLKCILTLLHLK